MTARDGKMVPTARATAEVEVDDDERLRSLLQALLPFAEMAPVTEEYRPAWRRIIEAARAEVVIPIEPRDLFEGEMLVEGSPPSGLVGEPIAFEDLTARDGDHSGRTYGAGE